MLRIMQSRSDSGDVFFPPWWLLLVLPLGLSSLWGPCQQQVEPQNVLRNGGFEMAVPASALPPIWQIEGGTAALDPQDPAEGKYCLRLETAGAAMIRQSLHVSGANLLNVSFRARGLPQEGHVLQLDISWRNPDGTAQSQVFDVKAHGDPRQWTDVSHQFVVPGKPGNVTLALRFTSVGGSGARASVWVDSVKVVASKD